MQELTSLEKQQQVSDLIGDWLDENNIFLLAKEGVLVYWSSTTGNEDDCTWHSLTIQEAARVAKVMLIPPQYMMHCTSDTVCMAAQERGRAYMEGIRSSKKVLPMYFNYTEHEKVVKPVHYEITHDALTWFYNHNLSPEWQLIKGIITDSFQRLELDELTDIRTNQFLVQAAKDLGYKVCKDKSRYSWRIDKTQPIKKWTCLRFPRSQGVFHTIESEIREELIQSLMEKYNERRKPTTRRK